MSVSSENRDSVNRIPQPPYIWNIRQSDKVYFFATVPALSLLVLPDI